jgi:hypothetical protein
MIAAPVHLPPPTVEAAETRVHRAPREFKATKEPTSQIRRAFALQKSVLQLEPGRLQLKLTAPPLIAVNPNTLECEVLGWDVYMSASEAENIPRAMTRRFLELFSKADIGRLEEHEQQCWVNILDQIDYQAFCIDRAAPHYMEGLVVTRQPNFTLVEWHDGTREKLEPHVARSLAFLECGDEFGAFVKLGRDNKALQIENITILETARM